MGALLGYSGAASVSIPFAGGNVGHKSGDTKSTIRMAGVPNGYMKGKPKKK